MWPYMISCQSPRLNYRESQAPPSNNFYLPLLFINPTLAYCLPPNMMTTFNNLEQAAVLALSHYLVEYNKITGSERPGSRCPWVRMTKKLKGKKSVCSWMENHHVCGMRIVNHANSPEFPTIGPSYALKCNNLVIPLKDKPVITGTLSVRLLNVINCTEEP